VSGDQTPVYRPIWARNELLLAEFEAWLLDDGLKAATAELYARAIGLFVNRYLAQGYSQERLPEGATAVALDSFLGGWHARKAAGRPNRMKTMIAALKRFYSFLPQTGRMADSAAQDILRLLKEERKVYLSRVKQPTTAVASAARPCR